MKRVNSDWATVTHEGGTVVHLLCNHISSPAIVHSLCVPRRFRRPRPSHHGVSWISLEAMLLAQPAGKVFERWLSVLPDTDLLWYLCPCRLPATWSILVSYIEGVSLIERAHRCLHVPCLRGSDRLCNVPSCSGAWWLIGSRISTAECTWRVYVWMISERTTYSVLLQPAE